MKQRKLPIGAEIDPAGGVNFRVWAPKRKVVRVVLEAGPGAPLTQELVAEAGRLFFGYGGRCRCRDGIPV